MSIPESYNTTITILFAIACFACSPGPIVSDGETGFEADDETGLWAETTCRQLDFAVACFGRPAGSVDTWVLIAQECTIDGLTAAEGWVPLEGWADDSCAVDTSPTGFWHSSRCGWMTANQRSVCMVGGDGWLTQAIPDCELPDAAQQAWPAWLCEGSAGNVGAHPWDAVMCSEDDLVACTAVDDNTGQSVWPTCWVDQWPLAKRPTC